MQSSRAGQKDVARVYERPGLSSDEIDELSEAFKLFDTEQSGTY